MKFEQRPQGQSIVEVILAVAIFAVGGSAVVMLLMNSFRSTRLGGEHLEAQAYAAEGWEAAKSIRNNAWNKLVPGTYGLTDASGSWAFSGSSDTSGQYTRSVMVESVDRDGSKNIVGSGTNDVQTRQVTSTVTWGIEGARIGSISDVHYLTNWDSREWFEDTTADFSDGTFSSTTTVTSHDSDGAVGLLASPILWSCAKTIGSYDKAGTSDGQDVFVSGNYAYLVTGSNSSGAEFFVINISTPESPTLVGSVELGADGNSVSVVGQYAYVAGSDNSNELRVIDVTTPATPSIVGSLNLAGNEDALDLVASGSRAYLVRGNVGGGSEFYTLNIGTPSSPSTLGSVDLGASSRGVALSGSYAYVVTDATTQEFRVVDVSVDATPTVAATIDLPPLTIGTELDVVGSYAYVITTNNASGSEFFVINITTPTAPSISGSLDLGNGATTIEMDSTTALIGTATAVARTLQVVDAATPTAPTLVVSQKLHNDSYNGLFWNGSYLFAATNDNNTELVVISRVANADWGCIEKKSDINLAGNTNARAVYVSGTTLYIGASTNAGGAEFFIYNVSDPTTPTLVGSLEVGDHINDLIVSGSYAYLATGGNSAELRVVDISTPSVPVSVGTYNAAGNTDGQGISISGNKILLTQGSTFYHLDVTTPISPSLLGSVGIGGTGYRIEVSSATYAFVATGDDSAEIRTINISANTPALAGSLNIAGTSDSQGIWIKGTTLYAVTNNSSGASFFVIDISTPTAPSSTGSLNLTQAAHAVAADDNETFAFAGVDRNGEVLQVIDVSAPGSPAKYAVAGTQNAFINDLYFSADVVYAGSQDNAAEVSIFGKLGGGGGGGGAYPTSGTYTSSIFDATDTANWNTIEWSEYVTGCGSGDIKLQLRTATTSGGLAAEMWQGPDGEDGDETDFFTDGNGELIDDSHNGDQFGQYLLTITGDGTCTVEMTDLAINYTTY